MRQKWRGLRDTFRKEISKLKEKRSGDAADVEPHSKWQFFNNMLFIKDFAPRKQTGNMDSDTQKYSTCSMTEENATMSPVNNDDQSQESQVDIETEMEQQNETSINPLSSNTNKRSAMDQAQLNRTNPPHKKPKTVQDDALQQLMSIEKEKLQHFKQRFEHKQDDDTFFLLSLIPYIQSLPVYRKLFLRSKFIELIMQEHEALSRPGTHPQPFSRQFIPIPSPSPGYSTTTSTEFSQPPTPVPQTTDTYLYNHTGSIAANAAQFLTTFQPNDFTK